MQKKDFLMDLIKDIKISDFILNCQMPMGYTNGYPILEVRNDTLCMIIPFLKYKITGTVDKTFVYPIRYTVTVELPEGRIAGFEDLSLNPAFGNMDFNKPIGLFRHESVKSYTKEKYNSEKKRLFDMYDKMIDYILYGGEYSGDDDNEFMMLLNTLLEPSLKPIYKILDKDFYDKYII